MRTVCDENGKPMNLMNLMRRKKVKSIFTATSAANTTSAPRLTMADLEAAMKIMRERKIAAQKDATFSVQITPKMADDMGYEDKQIITAHGFKVQINIKSGDKGGVAHEAR